MEERELIEKLVEGTIEKRTIELKQRTYEELQEEIAQLILDKIILQTRITKAIEYIETHQLNFKKGITTFGSERLSMEERKLLDILRGYDK